MKKTFYNLKKAEMILFYKKCGLQFHCLVPVFSLE